MLRSRTIVVFLGLFLFLPGRAAAQDGPDLQAAERAKKGGHFQFSVHYGSWSLNLMKGVFEGLAEGLAEQVKNNQLDSIREKHPEYSWEERSFENDVAFDSSGHTFGFEARWYPGGEDGSFSLGLSVVKTKMKFGLTELRTEMEIENVDTMKIFSFAADGSGDVTADPMAFLLSLRWDIAPRAVIHPYFTLGFGAAGVKALDETTIRYDFEGELAAPGEETEIISESDTKTLLELKQEDAERKAEEGSSEEPFDYPMKFFPFIQLHFGLKAKLARVVHLMVDFGILDGFSLRGGLAIRI
ncbi:MAG: hypothetical protein JW843_11665 [Candidatus Aminicenantes bacterium]|nr:hypothetical protein [Candidatus Aminicenantes bacterium]